MMAVGSLSISWAAPLKTSTYLQGGGPRGRQSCALWLPGRRVMGGGGELAGAGLAPSRLAQLAAVHSLLAFQPGAQRVLA